MNIEKGYIYHIYNQGNNHRKIFFNEKNYLFFLEKMKTYITPYADILAWCLMPNHFHFMVYVNETAITDLSDTMTLSHRITTARHRITQGGRTFNNSLAIMLRSYTRAINKQENFTGSLFKAHTQAINLSKPEGITPAWFMRFGVTMPNVAIGEKEYPNVCYRYILENPVKAKLVEQATDWHFSSARDVAGLRNGKLINKEKIKELIR